MHHKVSVVMPAYNEEEFIFDAVRAFFSIPEVDEVIVVEQQLKRRNEEAGSAGWCSFNCRSEAGLWAR